MCAFLLEIERVDIIHRSLYPLLGEMSPVGILAVNLGCIVAVDMDGIQFLQQLPRGVHGAWREVFLERDSEIFLTAAGDVLSEWNYE